MPDFTLETEHWLPRQPEEVFGFYADAFNLEQLTPPWLRFEVVTPPPIQMRSGVEIDYRLRLHGLRLQWRSRITDWDPPRRFVDEQVRGPYGKWVHEHTFTPHQGGALVRDYVQYAMLGGGWPTACWCDVTSGGFSPTARSASPKSSAASSLPELPFKLQPGWDDRVSDGLSLPADTTARSVGRYDGSAKRAAMNHEDETLRYRDPAQPAAPRRSRIFYGWYLVATAIMVSAVVFAVNRNFAIFAFYMAGDFGRSLSSFFLIVPLISVLTNGLSQPVIGYLFDRYDARKVICISIVVAGLATFGVGWISEYWALIFLFGIVFSGAMGGASFGILGPLAARWFLKRRLLVLSLLVALPALFNFVLAPISILAIDAYGWRYVWMALGAILLLIGLPAALVFVRSWPSDRGLKPDGEPETPMEARVRGGATVAQQGRFDVERWWQAFRSSPIWVLLPTVAVSEFTNSFTSTYLESFAHDSLRLGPQLIAVIQSVVAALGPIGAVAIGLVGDRFARKKVFGALLLTQGCAFLVLIAGYNYGLSLLLFAALAGLSGTAWMVIALSLIADVYGLRALATLWGIAFLFGSFGSFIGPIFGGLTIDLTGSYYMYFAVCASMLILASIAIFRINERKYSARYEAALGVDEVGD